jgi:fructokinase
MIVVAGEALIDLIVAGDGGVRAVPGGGPFNTARTVARLGVPCSFLGCLSTDRFGQRLRLALADDGVDLDAALTSDAPTTLAVAELDERGAATYRFYLEGTSAPALAEGARLPTPGVDALHVGTLGLVLEPVATTVERLAGDLPEEVLLMVDPNCRPAVIRDQPAWRRRLEAILARADVVKVSGDDLDFLLPGVARERAIEELVERGARVVLSTDGAGPVHVRASSLSLQLPVKQVSVVDTVGSGDAFGGGFLAWWIRNGLGRAELADPELLRTAVAEAVEVAALTCQRPGADPPTFAELLAARSGGLSGVA